MPSGVAGHGSQRIALIGSFGHELLRQLEVLRRDDLQIRECFRLRTAAPKHAGVHDIMQNVTNGSFVPVLSVTGLDAHLRQEVGDFESAVAGANTQVEHHTHDLCLIGIDLQLENLMLALVVCAAGYQVIAVRGGTTTEAAFLHHLPEGGLGTHGGFLTLTVCLPEADVVGEAVNMRINPLFTFVDAPNLNAVVDEPLDYERRFFSSSANTVEHEHQQDIEFALFSIFLIVFTIAAIDIPENDPNRQKLEEAFANKGVMGILGDDWGRQQATEILHTLAANPGAGGVAAAGAGMGMGMAAGGVFAGMAQQMFAPMQPQPPVQQPVQPTPSGRFVQRGAANGGTPPAQGAEDPVESLKKLKAMLDAGLIPQDVYNSKMNEILGRM